MTMNIARTANVEPGAKELPRLIRAAVIERQVAVGQCRVVGFQPIKGFVTVKIQHSRQEYFQSQYDYESSQEQRWDW